MIYNSGFQPFIFKYILAERNWVNFTKMNFSTQLRAHYMTIDKTQIQLYSVTYICCYER
jgi:hypothetical protein